jgi:hypothetical protein
MEKANIETNVIKPNLILKSEKEDLFLLNKEDENKLDSLLFSVEEYMKNNSGKGKTEEEKDELYKNAQEKWKEFASNLRKVKYNFFLNRIQWIFLTDVLLKKMEYDVDTVFFAIELTNLLGKYSNSKFIDDKQIKTFEVNATEITYIYHLIAKYKVKGLTKDAYVFSEILLKISDISKIINYYDTFGKNLSSDIQDWVMTFEEGVSIDK